MFACGWYSHSYFSVRNIQCDRVQGQRVARPPSSSHQHYLVLPESHLEQLGQTAWNNRRLVWSNFSILWGGNDSGRVYWKSESCPWAKCCLINTLTRDNRYWRHSFHSQVRRDQHVFVLEILFVLSAVLSGVFWVRWTFKSSPGECRLQNNMGTTSKCNRVFPGLQLSWLPLFMQSK